MKKIIALLMLLSIANGGCSQTADDPQAALKKKIAAQREEEKKIKEAQVARHKKFLSEMQGTWVALLTQPCPKQSTNKYGTSEFGLGLQVKLIITDSNYVCYIDEYLPNPKLKQNPIEERVVKSEGVLRLSQSPIYDDKEENFALVKLYLFRDINPSFDHYNGRNLSWDASSHKLLLSYYRGEGCKFTGHLERLN